jgi:hypothetical protein
LQAQGIAYQPSNYYGAEHVRFDHQSGHVVTMIFLPFCLAAFVPFLQFSATFILLFSVTFIAAASAHGPAAIHR